MFVNGRPVKDRLLNGAIRGAYQDFLARNRHPAVALFFTVPASEVDINVHPAKTEVRFRQAGLVRSMIVGGLRTALNAAGHRAATTVADSALSAFDAQPMQAGQSGFGEPAMQTLNPQVPISAQRQAGQGGDFLIWAATARQIYQNR